MQPAKGLSISHEATAEPHFSAERRLSHIEKIGFMIFVSQ